MAGKGIGTQSFMRMKTRERKKVTKLELRGLPASGPLAGHGGASSVYCQHSLLFQDPRKMKKPEIEAAAGCPSGRRPFIIMEGMGG